MKQEIYVDKNDFKKKNGSYYTPKIMADFIVKRLFNKNHYHLIQRDLNILEPSCGDGIFIEALHNYAIKKNKINSVSIDIVEREKKEIDKVKKYCNAENNKTDKKVKFNFVHNDYLKFQNSNTNKYDLVIANPPYIKKNYLTKQQLSYCEDIHSKAGLSKNKIKNIWTAFLISAVSSLKENGAIGFVLPSELMQVSFTKEIRGYLLKQFDKIEIFAFNELVFEASQDVIVILAVKKNERRIVSFFQANKVEDLIKPDLIPGNSNTNRDTLDKWTNFILSPRELNFLDKFKQSLNPASYYCDSQVGIVTAANSFFIINQDIASKYKLNSFLKPIIQKGSLLKNIIRIENNDFKKISLLNQPCYLLSLKDESENKFPINVKKYLEEGRKQKIPERYKCNLRNNWCCVPSQWGSDGLFVKRTDKLPKIIFNPKKILTTDSFYRINMKPRFDIKSLSFSFHNTLTFIFAELEGRFYGGGVLELTPNEFKNLPIPYTKVSENKFNEFDKMYRDSLEPDHIRKFIDKIILEKELKLSRKDLDRLNSIYNKLVRRRLKIQ